MTAIALTKSALLCAKRALRNSFPDNKSAHLSEALAAACGYRTHAALLAELGRKSPGDPDFVELDDEAFIHRLFSQTGEPVPLDEDFNWFESLRYPNKEGVVKTKSKGWHELSYKSERSRAWRNAMVAAINSGIAARLFTIRPGDNRWPGADQAGRDERSRYVYEFTVENIPAIAEVADAGWDELSFHVVLWPAREARLWISSSNAGFLAGDVFATGWLERRDGAWLQTSAKPPLWCRRSRLRDAALLEIRTRGYADRGDFKL